MGGNRGNTTKGPNRLVKTGLLGIGAVVFLAGGFGAATEPKALTPVAGDEMIGSWKRRPFVPGSLNDLINQFAPPERRDDLTLSLELYRNKEVGNYAVASYKIHGDSKFSGTATCMPGVGSDQNQPSLGVTEQPKPEGIKIYLANDVAELGGRVSKAQTIEATSEAARQVCVGGLTKDELSQLAPIWTDALVEKFA